MLSRASLFVALALAACHNNGGAGSELDIAYKHARDTLRPGDAWTTATAAAVASLGPPRQLTPTEWRWAALDADACYDFRLLRGPNNKVRGSLGARVPAGSERHPRCRELAALPPVTPP